MKKVKAIRIIILFIFSFLLVSCYVDIESSSANSISAIIAVCGEYILAVLSLILFFALRCLRVLGAAVTTFSIYLILCNLQMGTINSWLLFSIGLLLCLVSFYCPMKSYEPKVVIARNIGKRKKEESKNDSTKSRQQEIMVGLIVGIILIIIEKIIDFSFIK